MSQESDMLTCMQILATLFICKPLLRLCNILPNKLAHHLTTYCISWTQSNQSCLRTVVSDQHKVNKGLLNLHHIGRKYNTTAFTAQYVFIEHRNHVYKKNIHSLNGVCKDGSPHEMAAGETWRGKQTNALKFTEETTFIKPNNSQMFLAPHYISCMTSKIAFLTIVSSTNIDIPHLKCSTGTDTKLNCCSRKLKFRIRSRFHQVYKRKIITLYQDLFDAF